jgi:uncharacterized membrane protein
MATASSTGTARIAARYLKLLNIQVTATSVKRDILENPYYPGLLSLSDTFRKYGIDNTAFEIDKNDIDAIDLPPAFIAYVFFTGIGFDFVLVTKMTDTSVTYWYDDNKPRVVTKAEFLRTFQNIIWIARPDEHSGERDYTRKRKKETTIRNGKIAWIAGLTAVLLLAIGRNLHAAVTFSYIGILFIQLIGLTTTVLLLLYERNSNNPLVRHLCSAGPRADCATVLGSRASRIMGVSWSEIGLLYFTTTFLWLLMPSASFAAQTQWLAIANACAAPYVLFSIYYQWRVLRRWCPLCLTIQAVLVAGTVWSILYFWATPTPFRYDSTFTLFLIYSIALPALGWFALKPLLTAAHAVRFYQPAYARLRHNPDIFNSLLQQQDKAPDGWQQLAITIGNPAGKNRIIKVCSPFCGPCSKAHPILEDMISNNDVQVDIIFKVGNRKGSIEADLARHFLAIAAEGDRQKIQSSLDDWYLAGKKNYNLFAAKYPLAVQLESQDERLEAMGRWCDTAAIAGTPTIFVNSYKLPEAYDLEDLKTIL